MIGSWDWDAAAEGPDDWSDELFRILGLPPDAPASFDSFATRVHPEDRHCIDDALARIGHGARGFSADFRVVLDDGYVRWIRGRGEVTRGAQEGVGSRMNASTCSQRRAGPTWGCRSRNPAGRRWPSGRSRWSESKSSCCALMSFTLVPVTSDRGIARLRKRKSPGRRAYTDTGSGAVVAHLLWG